MALLISGHGLLVFRQPVRAFYEQSHWGKKKWQTECLTATTTYPCFCQDLGDSAGAGSTDLPLQKYVFLVEIKGVTLVL